MSSKPYGESIGSVQDIIQQGVRKTHTVQKESAYVKNEHELRIEKKYCANISKNQPQHSGIFNIFFNPLLLIKKIMKSDVSWKVNKSYVELEAPNKT